MRIYRFSAKMAEPGKRPPQGRPFSATSAADTALGLRPRIALSSDQLSPAWRKPSRLGNDSSLNGNYPLNFVSHGKGAVQIARNRNVIARDRRSKSLPLITLVIRISADSVEWYKRMIDRFSVSTTVYPGCAVSQIRALKDSRRVTSESSRTVCRLLLICCRSAEISRLCFRAGPLLRCWCRMRLAFILVACRSFAILPASPKGCL